MSFNPLKKLFKPDLVSYNDEDLMQLIALEQNHQAFEILYHRYKVQVFNYLCAQIPRSQAEDLLQEIFIKVAFKAKDFKGQSRVKTWIWSISRNSLIDFFRSSHYKFDLEKVSIDGKVNEDGEHSIDVASQDLSAEEKIIELTELAQIEACLNELSKEQKEIVLLHTHSEFSYKEIAEETKLSLAAVKSTLFRSKTKLIECFKRGGHQ